METALAEVIDAMAETNAVGNNEKKVKTVRGRKKPGTVLVFNQDAMPVRKKREEQAVPPQMLDVEMTRHVGVGLQGVAGMVDLKKRLKRDFVDIVSHRELAKKFSILPPNMLFYGPPGTGKTFLSMKLAEECGMEVCSIAPSDLASIWLHGSQRLIMELFNTAIEKAKKSERGCLVLIDEFDAVVPKRTSENRDQQAGEVAEFLVQLNDCVNKNVYVIGTTNCLDRIDKAVIRKGRIDQVIYVGMPDKECRRQLFEIELQKRPHEQTIDYEKLASLTEGYTSADISYIVKETSRNAFEESLEARGRRVVKINQKMLADVISVTRPSVSDADVLRYERMRDEYLNNNKNERRRIGFCY
jgi:transitional endoplasmic reticulum ATPase